MEYALLELLDERPRVLPSEVAHYLGGVAWRSWLEPARRAGRRLAARGEVRFLQSGREVDASTARGPVSIERLRSDRPGKSR